MTPAYAKRRRWHEVLTRFIAIIQSLAEQNIALRGTSTSKLSKPNNGNFLKELKVMAHFDPVLKNMLLRWKEKPNTHHTLEKNIQNELTDCTTERIVESLVFEIRQSKCFSIILDYSTDLSP